MFVTAFVVLGACWSAVNFYPRAFRQGYDAGFRDGVDGRTLVKEVRRGW